MDRKTVFTKTAKGITQVNQKSASLSKDLMKVLKLIDGKSNFEQIMEKADLDKMVLEKALNALIKDGFARVFETRKEEADPFAAEDDFDFTAPGKLPGATQRVVASAAGDISELARQQEARDTQAIQKKQLEAAQAAQAAARAKAKAEAESRAKLEADAKAKAEAEARAMEQAKKAKEAAERAKAELEAKLKEEQARKAALDAQREKLSAEQKVKEEAEAKRLAELRAKAEAEAKALADARAKAEAEAQALAKARADAEAAAKKQAAEAAGAEKELKARLKEEIEARIRSEMESLLRNEIEASARAEMQKQIMEEARMAAKAELDERLREERAQLQQAELAARTEAEKAARERADQEAKRAAEAEARAKQEAEARRKAEAEAEKLRAEREQLQAAEAAARSAAEAAARQRAEMAAKVEGEKREIADRAAREKEEIAARAAREKEALAAAAARDKEEIAKRLEVERRAKIEAEARAMVEAEERERREKEFAGKIESERKAREEAELRAKVEARARETIEEDTRAKVQAELEGDMTKRAEIEGKAQARAYMDAKAQAERDEDERMRAEQAQRAREIADVLRTKVTPDADEAAAATPVRRRRRKKGSFIKTAFVGLLILVVGGIAALHVVPLRGYATRIEKGLGAWLHDSVQISSLKFTMLPSPHLKIEGLSVGKVFDAKAAVGRVYIDLGGLLGGDKIAISSMELDGVTLTNEAVKRVLAWGNPEGKAAAAEIRSIRLKSVKVDVKPAVDPFDANFDFAPDGKLTSAYLSAGGKWTLDLKPRDKGMDVDFNARYWQLPIGAPVPVSDIGLKGVLTREELVVPEFEAHVMEGKVNGTLRVNWAGEGVTLESDLSLARLLAAELVKPFTKDVALTGKVEGNFNVVAQGPTIDQLFATTRSQGKFKITEGSISNVDLVAVMQSEAAGQRAGVTKFNELSAELTSADNRTSYRSVSLMGGVHRASGALDIDAKGALSGRLVLELRSNVMQDRGSYVVTGTVAKPSIRRGG